MKLEIMPPDDNGSFNFPQPCKGLFNQNCHSHCLSKWLLILTLTLKLTAIFYLTNVSLCKALDLIILPLKDLELEGK